MLRIYKIIKCNYIVCSDCIQTYHGSGVDVFFCLNSDFSTILIVKNNCNVSGFSSILCLFYRSNYVFNSINGYLISNFIQLFISNCNFNIFQLFCCICSYRTYRIFDVTNFNLITNSISTGCYFFMLKWSLYYDIAKAFQSCLLVCTDVGAFYFCKYSLFYDISL